MNYMRGLESKDKLDMGEISYFGEGMCQPDLYQNS